MAITLNLLPQEKVISQSTAKFLKGTKMLGVILFAAFILYAVGVGILIFFNDSKLQSYQAENARLLADLSALEKSEQQAFLLKDRLKKIQTLKLIPSSVINLTEAIALVDQLPESSKVTVLEVDSKKVDLTVNFKSNFDMSNFIDTVKNSERFKSVVISSYGLNPLNGYLVGFNLANLK